MTIPLREGFSVTFHGHHFRVIDIQPDRTVTLLNERTSSAKTFKHDEIEAYRQQGLLKIIEGQDILFREDGLPPIPAALPAHHRLKLQRSLCYVRAVLDQTPTVSCTRELKVIAASVSKLIHDDKPPSPSSLYRWCHRYVQSGEDVMSLAPLTANCGRRHGQIDVEVIEIFYIVIDTYYLTRARTSLRETHAELADRVIEANQNRSKTNWLRTVSYTGFCKLVKRLLDPFILMARRLGERAARRYFRTRDRGPSALFPLERVEIDHTTLDIILIHPITKAYLRRPTCTVAIDRRTRMVCGIYIDLEPPSSIAVLMCLRQAVMGKQGIVDSLSIDINLTWPVDGQFRLICMDNGPEFHGNAHKQFCADMHDDMQYCPPGKPWYKAAVERFIGTLNHQLIHRLPGTTWSNPVERGDYPSEKLAFLTLHELRQLVFQWVVVKYHNTRHSELGETPLQCWKRLIEEHPIPPLPDSLSLEAETGLTYQRKISNGRIGTKGLIYHHPYLVHLEEKLPEKQLFMLRIDPQDVTQAYIADPVNKALIKLKCLTPNVEPGTSWIEFQQSRKKIDSDVEKDIDPHTDTIRQEKAKFRRKVYQLHQDAEHELERKTRQKAREKYKKHSNNKTPNLPKPSSSKSSIPELEDSGIDAWFIERSNTKGAL